MKKMSLIDVDNYTTEVLANLESFDFPNLVFRFNPRHVADAIGKTIILCYMSSEVSSMMCSIIIWSMTMNYQNPASVRINK